jgi:hypothetical protein
MYFAETIFTGVGGTANRFKRNIIIAQSNAIVHGGAKFVFFPVLFTDSLITAVKGSAVVKLLLGEKVLARLETGIQVSSVDGRVITLPTSIVEHTIIEPFELSSNLHVDLIQSDYNSLSAVTSYTCGLYYNWARKGTL